MKIFLDANVLFSASDPGRATFSLFVLIKEKHEVVTSPHAWEEARRNIQAKRVPLQPGLEQLQTVVKITHAFYLPDTSPAEVVEKDKPILAGALGANCTHLWTSDRRHFGHLFGTTVQGLRICSSTQIADEFFKTEG